MLVDAVVALTGVALGFDSTVAAISHLLALPALEFQILAVDALVALGAATARAKGGGGASAAPPAAAAAAFAQGEEKFCAMMEGVLRCDNARLRWGGDFLRLHFILI